MPTKREGKAGDFFLFLEYRNNFVMWLLLVPGDRPEVWDCIAGAIRILIVDDQDSVRLVLAEQLIKMGVREVVQARSAIEAIEMFAAHKPDIVLLDIQMPGLTGFEVLKHLEEIPQIIFSTAYDKYALEAFEVHAVDYLLKLHLWNQLP